jgi:hypothetical protein
MTRRCPGSSRLIEYTRATPPFVIMPNPNKARAAGDEIVAMMAELASIWRLLSESERRRTLDGYAPLMAVLLRRQSEALAEDLLEAC